MRIVIAPDKFKGTLTAREAAEAIADGIGDVHPHAELDLCPMADGGEGTVDALSAGGGTRHTIEVTGPLPEMRVKADFVMLDPTTAVVEMAAASGLHRVPAGDRSPMGSTTFGTGELIAAAARAGARRILIGLGGSATLDGGIGCLQALGLTLLMNSGQTPSPTEPLCARDLNDVLTVKHGRGEITSGLELIALTDVSSPLYGPHGAAVIFGPQKGAAPQDIAENDAALRSFAARTQMTPIALTPGAGAAGGLGFGLAAFAGATLRPGGLAVADACGLTRRLAAATLCVTGEGQLDESSRTGKVVGVVSELCRSVGVPCVAVVGRAVPTAETFGLLAVFSLVAAADPVPANPCQALRATARDAFRNGFHGLRLF